MKIEGTLDFSGSGSTFRCSKRGFIWIYISNKSQYSSLAIGFDQWDIAFPFVGPLKKDLHVEC